jgi:hypothetical protein
LSGCAELLALVEKLTDLEASAPEKIAAEAHLERCPSCRGHFEFLASLNEESRALSFPEPPESYWEHLPRKVLDRIDSEKRPLPRFLEALFAPKMLRWGALGATLIAATTVGVSVLREDPRTPAPTAAAHQEPVPSAPVAPVDEAPVISGREAPPPGPAHEETQAQATAEPSAVPPMARDEPARAVAGAAPLESRPGSEENEGASAKSVPPVLAATEEAVATLDSSEDVASSSRENVPVEESRGRASAAPAALSRAVEDCEALRREVALLDGVGVQGAQRAERGQDEDARSDTRFRLALCSLERNEREATEEHRKLAIEDAEAFLALEREGPMTEEIREKLRRIKRD